MKISNLPTAYVSHLDELVRRMQTLEAKRAAEELFRATAEELGEAALQGVLEASADSHEGRSFS